MSVAPSQPALEDLAAELGRLLGMRGWRLATAESCTGGWVAQAVTAIAGSSDWFEGGLVTYSDATKIALLGVDPMLIERHGAVSLETAVAMAEGARRVLAVELAVAVSGIAGPGGGTATKPVGTVCFGFACAGRATLGERELFPGTREEVRARAVDFALARLVDLAS
jgi:nicotinamide-nucleotide amidase